MGKIFKPCQLADPDLFFPDKGENSHHLRVVKKICQQCSVQKECLTVAIVEKEYIGIWGGLSPTERKKVASNFPEGLTDYSTALNTLNPDIE